MEPLYDTLRGRRPADELDWSPGMTDAFDAAKTALANTALLAHPFPTFVDHKPLTFAMTKSSEPWSGRQQRQFSAISKYTTDIQHVADKDNFIADCLSWAVTGSVHLGLDYTAMAADQTADSEVQAYRTTPAVLLMDDTFPLKTC